MWTSVNLPSDLFHNLGSDMALKKFVIFSYLFLSAACLPYLNYKRFSHEDEYHFRNLWKLLIKSKISNKLIHNPFNFFSNKIKNDHILKKSYKISKAKFFPFITPSSHKKKIIKIIESI